tara:strand:- start:1024 stop:2001 length:978 start_codon:yes stop_codon:yes gene_type:complete
MNNSFTEYKKSLKNFNNRINDELTILLYHGVTSSKSKGIENYSGKHILKDQFYKQMKYLKENCHVLSIEEYIYLRDNKDSLPQKSVIISFDDGFENNYSDAAPILNDLNLEAVFYISSGVIGTELMFWVDILEDCINLYADRQLKITLDTSVEFDMNTNQQKIIALEKIKSFLKASDKVNRERIVNKIQELTQIVPSVSHASNYTKLTWKQLKEMHSNELFIIGGHSLYHDILTNFEGEQLEREIRKSIEILELNLNSKIQHYSYPEGQKEHYNEESIKILKDCGIICSPSAIVGLNKMEQDLFNLRRVMVGFNSLPFPFWDKTI